MTVATAPAKTITNSAVELLAERMRTAAIQTVTTPGCSEVNGPNLSALYYLLDITEARKPEARQALQLVTGLDYASDPIAQERFADAFNGPLFFIWQELRTWAYLNGTDALNEKTKACVCWTENSAPLHRGHCCMTALGQSCHDADNR